MAVVFQKPHALTDVPLHYCPGCTHGIVHRLVVGTDNNNIMFSPYHFLQDNQAQNKRFAGVNCTPKVRHKTFGVQFNYEAFIKRKTTNYSTFDCGRANQTSGEAM